MNMIRIDTDKLRSLIKNNGLNKTEFAATIGHESSFIPKCLKRGTMQMHDIMLIKQIYEADVEYHAPKDEPKYIPGEQLSFGIDPTAEKWPPRIVAEHYKLLAELQDVYYFITCGADDLIGETERKRMRDDLSSVITGLEIKMGGNV